MEGVSFAGAEHSTPVSIRPPVQLSTPKPKRPVQTPKTQSATWKSNTTGAKGTPGGSGVKSNGAAPNKPKPGRPVKSLPGRAKANAVPSVATVRFVDAANKWLKEMSPDKLPKDLESLKLLLNEALDLRYSQEIQLEHERLPGFFIPVVDAIDYRGLLERLSLATSRQNIRAIVYSKLEGLPITPVRPLYTPNRSVNAVPAQNTPMKASSSVISPVVSEASSSVAKIPAPISVSVDVAPSVPSSTKKEKAKLTPKSARIELPASTPEPRKHTLPKSSLSISVTAEDVSLSSGHEEVVVPLQGAAESATASKRVKLRHEKTAKKEKKRKRGTAEEDESMVAPEESTPVKENATKKRKTDAVAAETTVDSDGMTAAQRKSWNRRKARLQKTEEVRKAAKVTQGDKDAIKLAATLANRTGSVDTTGSDSANVSQSEDGQGNAASRREKRRLEGIRRAAEKVALERSLTEASDSMPSEDVQMDDSAAMEEDSVAPAVEASEAAEEPVVEVEFSTTTATPETETVEEPADVTPPAETIEEPRSVTPPTETIEEPRSVAPPSETIAESASVTPPAETAEVPSTTAAAPTHAVEVPVAIVTPSTEADVQMTNTQAGEAVSSSTTVEPVASAAPAPKSNRKTKRKKEEKQKTGSPENIATTVVQSIDNETLSSATPDAMVQEATPVVEASAAADQPKSIQEPKSNRRAERRKSMKKDQIEAVPVPAEATTEIAHMDASSAAATVVAPTETTPATNTSKSKSKPSKATKKPRPSSALAALAEWRAQQSQGDSASKGDSQPAAASSAPAPVARQENDAPEAEASTEESLEQESAVQTVPPIAKESSKPQAPTIAKANPQSQKPDAVDDTHQPSTASESESTPPASSTQIPLPPPSQQIARLPSSSPESYSSDSEESQDAWQKAHKRVRSPGSEDLEPEGDDDDDEEGEGEGEDGEDVGRRDADQLDEIDELDHSRRATPEAIASFTEPASLPSPMAVDTAAEDEEIESRSATPQAPSSPMSEPPSSMSPVVYTIPVSSIQQTLDEPVADEPMTETDEPMTETDEPMTETEEPEVATEVTDTRDGTPTLFAMTQDPMFTPTQTHSVPTPLTLTDLAAPTSPPMPSTGVVAFHDAMEEDAAADQAAMDEVTDNGNAQSSATRQTDNVSQSAGESATSRTISSQSQTSTGSPRRLRSRMRLRDGTQPETDPLKPLPLPTATPKKRGKQPKALSQAGTPVQKPAAAPKAVAAPETTMNGTTRDSADVDSPAPTMSRKERRIAASQSRIPALSSLSADALRKGRISRFNSSNGSLPTNGTMSQPTRMLAPHTQSAATSDTDEDDNADTDSGSDSGDEPKGGASSLPVGLANRVAGVAPAAKSRQSMGAMKGW